MNRPTPVITLDGPAGAGKGTIASMLSERLKWSLLDSGAIYRVAALATLNAGIDLTDEQAIVALLPSLKIDFKQGDAFLNDSCVTPQIRNEACAAATSQISALPQVRAALLQLQRNFRHGSGLIADGRDMGTVVFPDATHKFYLTASVEIRAERRLKQLSEQGLSANIADLIQEISARDERDSNRPIAPLKPASDAVIVDTSHLNQAAVFAQVWQHIQASI